MSLTGFIDDGYNREGVIKAEPRQWPEVTFTYRPMTASEIAEHTVKAKPLDENGWYALFAKVVASKLVAWSVRNSKGDAVEINPANVLRLAPNLALRLWQVVSGSTPDDGEDDTGNSQPV